MNNPIKYLGFCLFLATAIATKTVSAEDTSLWDMIPGTAQLKSVFQLIAGDPSGAAKTQMNFLQEGLVSSQLRSAYYLITGEPGKASDVQRKFFSNLEGLVDALPLIGHVKGGIHLLAGDQDRGWNALKSATSTTGTILGAAVLGPIGAVGGHLLTDSAITVGDYALNGNSSHPHGVIEYIANIGTKDAGEHFDALAGLALDCWGGRNVKTRKDSLMMSKSESETSVSGTKLEMGEYRKTHMTNGGTNILEGSDTSAEWHRIVKEELSRKGVDDVQLQTLFHRQALPRIQSAKELRGKKSPDTRVEEYGDAPQKPVPIFDDPLRETIYKAANANKAKKFYDSISKDPKYADFNLNKNLQAQIEKHNFVGLNSYANELVLNKLDFDELKSNLDYLTDHEKSLLSRNDFRTVNKEMIEVDSTLSALAGILGEDVRDMKTRLEKPPKYPYHPELDNLPNTHLKELVKRLKIEYSVSEDLHGVTVLNDFIRNNVKLMENNYCILTERSGVGPSGVDAYVLKVKGIESFPAHAQVLIDYNTPGFLKKDVPNPYRVKTFVKNPDSIFRIYAVNLIKKKLKN